MPIFLLETLWLLFELGTAAFSGRYYTRAETKTTCSTEIPSLMIPISSIVPKIAFPSSSLFLVSQEKRNALDFDLLLGIQVPKDSYGCQLELVFPYGYQMNNVLTNRIEFWRVNGAVSPNSSWTNAPQKRSLLGSALIESGTTKVIINSSKCQEMQSLRASVANNQRGGIFVFDQLRSEGLILTYNCERNCSSS